MRFSFFGHQVVPSCSWNLWDRCVWLVQLDSNITFWMSVVVLCLKCQCGNGSSHDFEGWAIVLRLPMMWQDSSAFLTGYCLRETGPHQPTSERKAPRTVWGIRTVTCPVLLLLQLLRPWNTLAVCPWVNKEAPGFPGTHRPSERPPLYCQIAPGPAWLREKV